MSWKAPPWLEKEAVSATLTADAYDRLRRASVASGLSRSCLIDAAVRALDAGELVEVATKQKDTDRDERREWNRLESSVPG